MKIFRKSVPPMFGGPIELLGSQGPPPEPPDIPLDALLTEDGDVVITEDGDFVVTE